MRRDLYLDRYGVPNIDERGANPNTPHPFRLEPYWTEKRIVAEIKRWARKHGRPPKYNDWRRPTGQRANGELLGAGTDRRPRPSVHRVRMVFGSWNAALAAAGFPPRQPGGQRSTGSCRRGHAYTAENTITRDGGRECRTCRNAAKRAAYQRNSAPTRRHRSKYRDAQEAA